MINLRQGEGGGHFKLAVTVLHSYCLSSIEELNTGERPPLVFFLGPTKPLQSDD
jgi:hypothetical protein